MVYISNGHFLFLVLYYTKGPAVQSPYKSYSTDNHPNMIIAFTSLTILYISFLPRLWFTFSVKYCENNNFNLFNGVKYRIGKSEKQSTPEIFINFGVNFRIALNGVKCSVKTGQKSISKILKLLFIPGNNIYNIFFSN